MASNPGPESIKGTYMNLFKLKTIALSASALMSSTFVFGMQQLPPSQTLSPAPKPTQVVMHQAAPAVIINNNNMVLGRVTYLHRDISFATPSLQTVPVPHGNGLYKSPAYLLTGTIYLPAQPKSPNTK